MFGELLGVGDGTDDPEAGGAVGVSDEAFVGTLGRADGAPDLCEGDKGIVRVTAGPWGGWIGPVHDSRGMNEHLIPQPG